MKSKMIINKNEKFGEGSVFFIGKGFYVSFFNQLKNF